MRCLNKVISVGLAMMSVVAISCTTALAFEHPTWSGVDEDGNALIQVQNPDGT